jgi:hypothetical protein
VDEFVDGHRVQRDIFPDTRPFDHEVETPARDGAGRQFIDGAGAGKAFALGLEPLLREPVLRQEVLPEGRAKPREIKIAAVVGFQVNVIHPQKRHLGAAARQTGWQRDWGRRRRGAGKRVR